MIEYYYNMFVYSTTVCGQYHREYGNLLSLTAETWTELLFTYFCDQQTYHSVNTIAFVGKTELEQAVGVH